jgi:hypothetical protein
MAAGAPERGCPAGSVAHRLPPSVPQALRDPADVARLVGERAIVGNPHWAGALDVPGWSALWRAVRGQVPGRLGTATPAISGQPCGAAPARTEHRPAEASAFAFPPARRRPHREVEKELRTGEGPSGRLRSEILQHRKRLASCDGITGLPARRRCRFARIPALRSAATSTCASRRGCRIYRRRPKQARFPATDLSRTLPEVLRTAHLTAHLRAR